MPSITVSEETFRRLSEWATALNISVETLVGPALDQIISAGTPESLMRYAVWNCLTTFDLSSDAGLSPSTLTGEAWVTTFEEWGRTAAKRADRYPRGFVLDEGREAIYRERLDTQC